MSKQMTLKSGKKVTLVEMSVDQFSSSTMWIRAGVKKVDDKFIKSLSVEDRAELQIAIQEYNSLGE